ncbi:MAG: copper transporter [Limnochordales bacterium]|nr:copper transporter [Limnochordales bacterium]
MIRGRLPLATLVAIFASLGLGLMIGAAISGSDATWLRQQAVLSNLEAEVARVRSAQDQLTQRLHDEVAARQVAESANHTLLEWAVADRLSGERIALLYTSPAAAQASQRLRQLLQLAGSQVVYEERLDTLAGGSSAVARLVAEIAATSAGGREAGPGGSDSNTEVPPATGASRPSLPSPAPGSPAAAERRQPETVGRAATTGSLVMLVLAAGTKAADSATATMGGAAVDTEQAVLNQHRQLLHAAREQGIERIALGIFRKSSQIPDIPDSLVQLYLRQEALVVDGMEKSGGQAALVLGLCVGVRGLVGAFPDAVLIPAYPGPSLPVHGQIQQRTNEEARRERGQEVGFG